MGTPLHRSLTEFILLGGAPRSAAIVNSNLAAALSIGLQLWVAGLILGIVGHSLTVWGAKLDHRFLEVFARHLKHRGYLDAWGLNRMLNLAEYRTRRSEISDYLPWAGLVAPAVVLKNDGSFQRTACFRGPDVESATDNELAIVGSHGNNAFWRLGSGWAAFIEAQRAPASDYPTSNFPEGLSWLIEE